MTKDFSKEENILPRIAHVMDSLEYSPGEFAILTGVSRTTANNIKTGKAKPTFKFVTTITTMLPVSKDWLLFGRGDPFTVGDISSYVKEKKKKRKYNPIDKAMNKRLVTVREETLIGKNKMTQAEYAHKLGVTKYTISNIETNKNGINAVIVKKLVEVFHVNPIWFLTGSGNHYLRNKRT